MNFLLARCYIYFFRVKISSLVVLKSIQLLGLKFYMLKLIICSLRVVFCHVVFGFRISAILIHGGLAAGCPWLVERINLLRISEKYSIATGHP